MCFIVLMRVPALRNTADNPSDRAYWRDLLRHDRPAERYRSVMRRGLDWLDSRLSSHKAQQGPAQKAWNCGLLNATMALALAYPILAITIQWLCGHAIDFGGQEVIAASPPNARIFTAVWLGSSLFFYLFAGVSKSRWRWPSFILATGILLLGLSYADRYAVPENVAFPVAGASAAAVAFVGAGVGAVAFAVAEVRSSRPMAWRLLYCGVLVTLLIVAIKGPDDFGAGQRTQAVFFMLTFCLLPLANAVFDFASVGLTRYLLRLGLEQKRAAWPAVLDGLGGIAIFFALGCTLIAFVVPAHGVPLVDLAQLFTDLRRTPGDYVWLMITLFFTLIPTLLHLSVAVLTMALQYPAWWCNFVAGLLKRGEQSGQAAFFSGLFICAMITIVLWVFETFAWAIGGI
ncbi:hypothetical protein IMCC1933_04460 [Rhodobacteraceae bacterium IMCC1933]|nr:hypothetical protein [Rhodobacteraceae bacterium IMCC1923]MDP4066910.1 hypothetical protein [Rhodobacteraceae bacterium IMCC1933]MDP4072023.1 hypothetical protein [Rhodobacteraceae bacterium IMCC1909]